MAGVEKRSLDTPDESRTPANAKIDVVTVGGATVGRATFQPGWRWSESTKPIVGTDDCQVHHLGVLVAGQLRVVHSDGSEADLAAGDIYNIQPGHGVLGDEVAVGIEFDTATAMRFAKE